MINIRSSAGMASTLNLLADNKLKELLTLRMAQLSEWEGYDIGEISQFVVMTAGDCDADAANDLTFSLLENMVDGTKFPNEGFDPSFEFIDYHADREGPGWWELIYIVTNDFGVTVFVHDHKNSDPDLLAMCREYSDVKNDQ